MVAAGICYSCGRNQDSGVSGDGIFLAGGPSGQSLLENGTDLATGIAPLDGTAPESGASAEADAAPGEGAGAADSAAAAQSTSAPTVYVHICGAVERPGVYQVEEGSRVYQVVEEAGRIPGGGRAGLLEHGGRRVRRNEAGGPLRGRAAGRAGIRGDGAGRGGTFRLRSRENKHKYSRRSGSDDVNRASGNPGRRTSSATRSRTAGFKR